MCRRPFKSWRSRAVLALALLSFSSCGNPRTVGKPGEEVQVFGTQLFLNLSDAPDPKARLRSHLDAGETVTVLARRWVDDHVEKLEFVQIQRKSGETGWLMLHPEFSVLLPVGAVTREHAVAYRKKLRGPDSFCKNQLRELTGIWSNGLGICIGRPGQILLPDSAGLLRSYCQIRAVEKQSNATTIRLVSDRPYGEEWCPTVTLRETGDGRYEFDGEPIEKRTGIDKVPEAMRGIYRDESAPHTQSDIRYIEITLCDPPFTFKYGQFGFEWTEEANELIPSNPPDFQPRIYSFPLEDFDNGWYELPPGVLADMQRRECEDQGTTVSDNAESAEAAPDPAPP